MSDGAVWKAKKPVVYQICFLEPHPASKRTPQLRHHKTHGFSVVTQNWRDHHRDQ